MDLICIEDIIPNNFYRLSEGVPKRIWVARLKSSVGVSLVLGKESQLEVTEICMSPVVYLRQIKDWQIDGYKLVQRVKGIQTEDNSKVKVEVDRQEERGKGYVERKGFFSSYVLSIKYY